MKKVMGDIEEGTTWGHIFKKAARGAVLSVGSMPIGGKKGQAPVKTAYRESLSQMKSLLAVEMTKSLNNALAEMAGPFRRGE